MPRLFVALRPPPAVRRALEGLQDGVPEIRWQEDDQIHLTLRYIGEVDRRVAEDIVLALGQIRAPAMEVALCGVGAFVIAARVPTPAVAVVRRDDVPTVRRDRATDPTHHPLAPRAPGLD